ALSPPPPSAPHRAAQESSRRCRWRERPRASANTAVSSANCLLVGGRSARLPTRRWAEEVPGTRASPGAEGRRGTLSRRWLSLRGGPRYQNERTAAANGTYPRDPRL